MNTMLQLALEPELDFEEFRRVGDFKDRPNVSEEWSGLQEIDKTPAPLLKGFLCLISISYQRGGVRLCLITHSVSRISLICSSVKISRMTCIIMIARASATPCACIRYVSRAVSSKSSQGSRYSMCCASAACAAFPSISRISSFIKELRPFFMQYSTMHKGGFGV